MTVNLHHNVPFMGTKSKADNKLGQLVSRWLIILIYIVLSKKLNHGNLHFFHCAEKNEAKFVNNSLVCITLGNK